MSSSLDNFFAKVFNVQINHLTKSCSLDLLTFILLLFLTMEI